MAAASVAAGADGLIVEVHPEPEKALSDGYQTLDFAEFQELNDPLRRVAEAVGRRLDDGICDGRKTPQKHDAIEGCQS